MEKDDNDYTTIRVRTETRDRINNLRKGSQTQDDFLTEMMDYCHGKPGDTKTDGS